MKIGAVETKGVAKRGDCLVVGVFEHADKKNLDLTDQLGALDKRLTEKAAEAAKLEGFRGEADKSFSMLTNKSAGPRRLVLVGLGEKGDLTIDKLRRFGGVLHKAGERVRAKTVTVVVPLHDEIDEAHALGAVSEGAQLSAYKFDRYLSDKPKTYVRAIELATDLPKKEHTPALRRSRAVAAGVALARDLVNECPGALTPEQFAEEARTVGEKVGLEVTVLDEKGIADENMGLVSAVAAAASPYKPPRVVRLAYRPENPRKHIALVGKGLVFDSGGLDLKPPAAMLDMKIDMAGAGAVLGAMLAIGRIKPDVSVTAILGCVENGIGGNAYHPSDVIKSRKGLTVEVNNTDAEGRLVLADCIDWVLEKDKPDVLIDLATLTGACMVAVGPLTAGLFASDDTLSADVITAGQRAGEDFWRMPLNEELRYQLKSSVADMKNTGERYGGAITAALFLKSFVDGRAAWSHLDIAGPVTTTRDHPYTPKGATGFGVRTLVSVVSPE
jgi:leucyl aminopeptidase